MKPTFEEAENAAKIIRQYMCGKKVCETWWGKEADEISHCSSILGRWTHDGQITMEHINTEFEDEYEYAHDISVHNYHCEEASCEGCV